MRLGLSSPTLERLAAVIDELASEDVSFVDGQELIDSQRLQDRLQFEFARRLAAFDRDRGFAGDGSCSTVSWLRYRCKLSGPAAKTRVTVARRLPELPQTSAAFAAGEISLAHAASIAFTAEKIGSDVVAGAEDILLPAARKLDGKLFGYVTSRLRHAVDPDGSLKETLDDRERNYFQFSQSWKGQWFFEGRLDPESGAIVDKAISAMMPPHNNTDHRSCWERRADALVEMARQKLQAGTLPKVGGTRPHLVLTAGLETLRRELGAPPGELQGGPPMHMESVRRLACDCSLTPIITDGKGNPLDVGRTRRTVSPALRRAATVRDGGCIFPGCDRPPEWCEGHHIKHWADGGPTALSNTALLCGFHHTFPHERGWKVSSGPDGKAIVEPP